MNQFEKISIKPCTQRNISMNKKYVIIPACYASLFPSMSCNLLASGNMMAFKDDENGDIRIGRTKKSTSLTLTSNILCNEIRSKFNLPEERVKLKTWIDDNLLIFTK